MSIFQKALCGLIRLYQKFISPGLGRNCRFSPSCSQYGIEAIRTHGCVKGLLLTAWRIARCNPLGRWGYDPVPEKGRWKNPARHLSASALFPPDTKNKWKTSSLMLFERALKRGRPLRQCPLKKGGREEGNLSVTPAACYLPRRGEAERKSYYNCFL